MKKSNFKNHFLKRILLFSVLLAMILCSSCSSEEVLFSFDGKQITSSIYTCYYERNKESVIQKYKNYYTTYGESFKAIFGFIPEETEEYWNGKFWEEKLSGNDKTMRQLLAESTERGCKEYLVYEKIASDYGYTGLPKEITSQFDSQKKQNIDKYGSYESWTIATIGQYGITADELMSLSITSSYGIVLPEFIFGEKGNKISDENSLASLEDSVQFMYSVYYFQDKEISEDVSSEENFQTEANNNKDYNEYYKNKMYSNYDSVIKGEKSFEEVYKDSDEYSFAVEKAPNGYLLTKESFNNYFSMECESYKVGDIVVTENESGIFMIKFVDFTSEYIKANKESIIDDMFDEILETYFSKVSVNEELLSSLVSNMK